MSQRIQVWMVMVSVLACGAAYGQPVEPAPVRSTVPKDAIDLQASRAFPKHDKPFYVADRAKAIYGQLHIAGPMRPHTRWRTGETSGDRVHIRIAFNRPVEIGCLIGGDGWEVATLSSDAPAPGDVNDEQQWRPVPDVPGQAGLRVLPLPRQIETWAIRLTRRRPEDKTGAWRGELPGLLILDRRLHNWTPEAVAFASTPPPESEQARQRHGVANLVEGGVFSAWPAKTISPDEPARVVLRWDEPRPVRVIGLRDAFADRVEFDIYTGPADTHPLTASPEHWRHVGGMNPPVWWRPAYADGYVDLGETFETSALRVRFTRPLTDENPDVARVTRREPNLVRLGGLMAMGDLGDAPAPARPEPAPPRPVLSVDYRMPFDGKVAVAIDDEHGHRVRNLIADVERGAGQLSEPWDGLDEMGQPVPAGTYTVKTIAHQPLSLRWRMTPNNARDIPWWTRSTWGGIAGPGSFLSDHAPPRSVATVGEQVFIGAAVAESGHSLVALDLDGTKLWGTKWLETAGASHLATDGQTLYVGAEGGWIRDQVMIFALDPQTYEHRRLVRFAADPTNRPGGISGLAAHEGRIFAAFNAPPYSSLAGALSTGNLDVGHCFPDGIANPRHGGEGARALGALLRAGGKPASHYELTPETVDGRPMIRIAFESPQPIGSIVLPACGTTFSALKEGVRFPGEMGDDRHWTRLPQETVGKMTVVTAPPATVTRALRLTWPADAQAPRCPGFKILPKRMINLAGEASATASSGDVQAGLAWQSEKRKDDRPITLLDPATLTARFDEPRALRGLALIHPMFKRARVEVERDGAWRDAGELTPPTWWRPSYRDAYHDLGEAMEVTAVRLVITEAFSREHADIRNWTGGRPLKAAVGGIAPLSPVGEDPPLDRLPPQRVTVYDAASGGETRHLPLAEPRGLTVDEAGRLLAISGAQVVQLDPESGDTTPIITRDLDEPYDLAVAEGGWIYVSDGGPHQVKVFDRTGALQRTIGKPGGRSAGPYDPAHMHHPRGIDLDRRGQLWVAESSRKPKRVSWWDGGDGEYAGQKMGPSRYGGGGWLDPVDPRKFYYRGMEFRLDWDAGTWALANILWAGGEGPQPPVGAVERPIHHDGRHFQVTDPGHQYGRFAVIAEHRGDRVQPLAAAGLAGQWDVLKTERFARVLGADLPGKGFLWVDADGDGAPQPDEIELGPALKHAYFTSFIGDDLTLNYGETQIPARGFNDAGAPNYSFEHVERREPMPVDGVYSTARLPDGSLFGVSSPIMIQNPDGSARWTYPEHYLGVHASHRAPAPETGEMSGSLLFIGHTEATDDVPALTGVCSNFGYYTLFTNDGLLAARLFHDYRTGAPSWHMPRADRGMEVGHMTLGGEHFYGSFTRTEDDRYFVVAGHNHSSIVEVHGLDTLTRGERELEITPDMIAANDRYLRELARMEVKTERPKFVRARRMDVTIDGKLDDWADAATLDIETRATAHVGWDAGRLLLAFDVTDPTPLINHGEDVKYLFKTGDSVDLQIATNPDADPKRITPAVGDVRLLITRTDGGPVAVLYRHRAADAAEDEATFFSSPSRTVRVDQIEVLEDVEFAFAERRGGYRVEVAVPMAALGLKVPIGLRLPMDVGVLLGDKAGEDVRRRLYWANPTTTLINDVPSEIQLSPGLWGAVEFVE